MRYQTMKYLQQILDVTGTKQHCRYQDDGIERHHHVVNTEFEEIPEYMAGLVQKWQQQNQTYHKHFKVRRSRNHFFTHENVSFSQLKIKKKTIIHPLHNHYEFFL